MANDSAEVPSTSTSADGEIYYEEGHASKVDVSRKQTARYRVISSMSLAEAFLCASAAFTGHLPFYFTLASMLAIQNLVLMYRTRKFVEEISNDHLIQVRVTPILKELCEQQGCAVPRVSLRRFSHPAAMLLGKGHVTLVLSPDFLRDADDAVVRAVISHELSHVRGNDLVAARQRMLFALGVPYVVGLILAFTIGHGAWLAVLLLVALYIPSARILGLLIGFSNRARESRADEESATVTGDPEAMIRGLTLVYGFAQESRDRIFGRSPWKWAFIPFSLPATTHPSLERRIERLRQMSSARTDV